MSGLVAQGVRDEETVLSAERAKSLDATLFVNDGDNLPTLANSDADPGFRSMEIILPNGDTYSGTLLGSTPEGSARYAWVDGCIYEGEWRRGMRHGNGKLQWPSGAVYEGEFSGGYMHGKGTYSVPDRLTYTGRWRLSLKHGLGHQVFANGDAFEGSWIQGKPEGPGKYTWADGNLYVGNMKGGKMSGKGTVTWTNGDMFKGYWSNGMMHGFGVYTWRESGFYVGTWTHGLKDGKGVFYPTGCKISGAQELYLTALRKRGLLPDFKNQSQVSHIHHTSTVDIGNSEVRVNHGSIENSSGNGLQRRWSLEVSIEKVLGRVPSFRFSESILEDVEKDDEMKNPILEREYMQGVLISELVMSSRFSPRQTKRWRKLTKELKKPGVMIIKGHHSYDLMLSLQLGIRYTVGKITPIQRREVRASDFGPRASFWMNFPREGSQLTPCHQSQDFKWKDYCPMVFRNLREMFKIDAADYMMSICGNDALRVLSSPGKSGSLFFLSQDDRFMIKTLRKSEVKVLLRLLPDYHNHVRSYDNTLVTKFFGLHRIKPSSGQKFCFVVMGNMFCTELRIHRRFDLKGSSLGRSADNVEIDENTILKDLDLNYCFYLEPSWRDDLLKQIETDSKFLESQNIMDYSLLLGVHYRAPQMLQALKSSAGSTKVEKLESLTEDVLEDDLYPQSLVLVARGADDNTVVVGPHIRGGRLKASSAAGDEEVDLLLGRTRLQIQLGVNMPARAEQVREETEGSFHEVYDVVLYLGIIDILQDYNMSKRIEHAFKSIQFDSVSISAVDPTFYSERFLEFIRKVFPPNVTAS